MVPWTTNVTAELHDLISALSLRLGPIARVAFDWNTISSAQRRIDEVDGLEVRGPYPGQPHDLMYLDDIYGRQLVLMMIPPYTDRTRSCGGWWILSAAKPIGCSEIFLTCGGRISRFLNMRPVCLV